jgi:hypothetical protein
MIADILRFILLSVAALIIVPPVLVIFLPIITAYFIFLLIFKLITIIAPHDTIIDIYNEVEEFAFLMCGIPLLILYPILDGLS